MITVERLARALCLSWGYKNPDRLIGGLPLWDCWRVPAEKLLEDASASDLATLEIFCDNPTMEIFQ